MENSKGENTTVKKDQMETNGRTKKERRALKVKQKQKSAGPPATSNKTENSSPKVINGSSPTSSKQKKVHNVEKPVEVIGAELNGVPNSQLSEKELRKLEWEKKLAEQKSQGTGVDKEGVSKAELRAKRREQQEAQRLAKTNTNVEPKQATDPKKQAPKEQENKSKEEPIPFKTVKKRPAAKKSRKVELVGHFYKATTNQTEYDGTIVNYKQVHPAFVRLGVQYGTNRILGSNARCLSLLAAVKCLVHDSKAPPKQEFCRYLELTLQSCVDYLQHCRPIAVSMANVLRHFKARLGEASLINPDSEKKAYLIEAIDSYIRDEIDKAGEAISLKVNGKILNGDVILTHGCSSLVRKILLDAHRKGTKFQVIVADGLPLFEGRQTLQRLARAGIHCSYVQLNAVHLVMGLATKVMLGAHALLNNGCVMSRVGTARVVLEAQFYNKPVLVCCETYKFSERVLVGAFVCNELGNTDMLTTVDTIDDFSPLRSTRKKADFSVINLLYDVTPSDLFTAVVTELAIMPCTSVPVVLRIK